MTKKIISAFATFWMKIHLFTREILENTLHHALHIQMTFSTLLGDQKYRITPISKLLPYLITTLFNRRSNKNRKIRLPFFLQGLKHFLNNPFLETSPASMHNPKPFFSHNCYRITIRNSYFQPNSFLIGIYSVSLYCILPVRIPFMNVSTMDLFTSKERFYGCIFP